MSKLIDLQQQLESTQNSMNYHTRHGGSKSDECYKEWEIKEAAILAQMDEVKRQELVDSVTAESQASDKSFVIVCGDFEADFRALAAGEDEYQMLQVTTRLHLATLESNHQKEINALKASFQADLKVEQDENEKLRDEMEQLRLDLADVRGKLETAKNLNTDLEMERDNAVKESEAKSKQIEELRQQITEKPVVATNIGGSEELAAIKARLEAKKIPVYNIRPGDHKTSFYLAQLAETGEEIEIRPYYDLKSKYREVTADEAARFRAENEATEAANTHMEEASPNDTTLVVPPALSFQDEITTTGLVGDDVVSTGDGEAAEETFEQEVRRRLKHLEDSVYGKPQTEAA